MKSQLRQHKRYYFLLLSLLAGALFVGFNSAQATQLRTASSGVLAAPTPNPAFVCTVVAVNGLNLRTGPGRNYDIITLLKGTKTKPVKAQPLAASPDRKWIQVVKIGVGKQPTGWVSADPTQIVCNVLLSQLAVGIVPPTPTPASVSPTPTPDSISFSPVPSQGGSPDGLDGRILVDRAALVRGSDEPVFRDRLSIQMDVSDPDAASGLGIKAVEFTIRNDDTGDEYYFHRENGAPYCIFGNQGKTCDTVWSFRQNGTLWPKSDRPVAEGWDRRINPNTVYRADVRALSEDGNKEGNWNFTFRIIPTNTASHAVYLVPSVGFSRLNTDYEGEVRVQYDTVVDNSGGIVTFGDRMVFQLYISDRFGGPNGEGVGEVQFEVRDSNTNELVYQHTERNAPYCVFGNDQSHCNNIWRFADTGFQWPKSDDSALGSQQLQPGTEYQATMIVRDTNGDEVGSWDFALRVQ